MPEIAKIKPFLEAISYGNKNDARAVLKTGTHPFVTISRQAGAGGNSLAAAILEELKNKDGESFSGWQPFNREVYERIAQEPGLKLCLEAYERSECRSQIGDILEQMVIGVTPQDVVNKKIFEWTRAFAALGKVILVGRGGVCLTRDLPLGVHIRLIAPLEQRIKRAAELFSMTRAKAADYIAEQDKGRARLMKVYFSQDIDNPLLYDVIWNTGTVSLGEIAKSVVLMVERKAKGIRGT